MMEIKQRPYVSYNEFNCGFFLYYDVGWEAIVGFSVDKMQWQILWANGEIEYV